MKNFGIPGEDIYTNRNKNFNSLRIKLNVLVGVLFPHHSIYLKVKSEILLDVLQLNQIREIQTVSHHRIMGGHHLHNDNVSTITYHAYEVVHRSI